MDILKCCYSLWQPFTSKGQDELSPFLWDFFSPAVWCNVVWLVLETAAQVLMCPGNPGHVCGASACAVSLPWHNLALPCSTRKPLGLPNIFLCFLLVYHSSLIHSKVMSLWSRKASFCVLDKNCLPRVWIWFMWSIVVYVKTLGFLQVICSSWTD